MHFICFRLYNIIHKNKINSILKNKEKCPYDDYQVVCPRTFCMLQVAGNSSNKNININIQNSLSGMQYGDSCWYQHMSEWKAKKLLMKLQKMLHKDKSPQ